MLFKKMRQWRLDPTQRCCYPVPCANVSENAMSNTRNIGLNHCIAGPSSSLVVSLSMAKSSSISLSESASKVINYINGIIMGCTLHGMGWYFKSWCQTNRPCSSSNFFKVLGDSMVGIAWGCAVLKPWIVWNLAILKNHHFQIVTTNQMIITPSQVVIELYTTWIYMMIFQGGGIPGHTTVVLLQGRLSGDHSKAFSVAWTADFFSANCVFQKIYMISNGIFCNQKTIR